MADTNGDGDHEMHDTVAGADTNGDVVVEKQRLRLVCSLL